MLFLCIASRLSAPLAPFSAWGLRHPEQSLADVWRVEARSAQIGAPKSIVQHFQRSSYSIKPDAAIRARNLLSKNCCRAALLDEAAELGPEVSAIGKPFVPAFTAYENSGAERMRQYVSFLAAARALAFFSGDAERWTRAAACPCFFVLWPSGEGESERPSSDAGEEMALGKTGEVGSCDVADVPIVNDAFGEFSGTDKLFDPGAGFGVVVIIIVHFVGVFFSRV